MPKQHQLTPVAEAQSDTLGRLSRALDDAQRALDSSLSGERKAAAGYRRQNAANRTGGDNFDPDELAAAVKDARELIAACQPLSDLLNRRARLAEVATALPGRAAA